MKINTTTAFIAALGLHLAILGILVVNVSLDKPERPEDEAGQIMHAVMVSVLPAKGVESGKAQAVKAPEPQKVVDTKAAEEKAKAQQELAKKVEAQKKQEQERKAALALKKKQEAEAKAKAEAERKAKAEAEAKAKAEAEAEKKAMALAEKKAKEEAERKAKEEAEKKAKAEAEAKAKAEAERKAKEAAEAEARRLEEEILGTADGVAGGEGLGSGSGVASEYGAKVQQLIEQNWHIDPSMNGKQVVVTVTVGPDGLISDEKCQGDSTVCASALGTLRLIGMLPRPPAKCPDCNTIVITMTPKV